MFDKKYLRIRVFDNSRGEEFIKLSGGAVSSIIKPAEDGRGIIVRIFNPAGNATDYRLDIKFPYESVFEVFLDERKIKPLDKSDLLKGKLGKYQIRTIYFKL